MSIAQHLQAIADELEREKRRLRKMWFTVATENALHEIRNIYPALADETIAAFRRAAELADKERT